MNHIYSKNPEGHSPQNEVNCERTELSLYMMGNFLTTENLPLTSLVVLKYYRQSIHNEQTVNVYSVLVKMYRNTVCY